MKRRSKVAIAAAALVLVGGVAVAAGRTVTYSQNGHTSTAKATGGVVIVTPEPFTVTPPPITVTVGTPAPTATSTSTPTTTATTTSPTSSPTTSTPPTGSYPDSSTTGVPTGVTLAAYGGPCTITSPVKLDGLDVKTKCSGLVIQTTGVVITNSRVPYVDSTYRDGASSVDISDSDVQAGAWSEGALWGYHITATRVDVSGGQHSVHCNDDCTVRDSYLHGQYNPTSVKNGYHNNAVISNGGTGLTVTGSTLWCDATYNPNNDGGCSGDVSLFGDFDPIADVLIQGNLLKANDSSISFCARGGYEPQKAFPKPSNVRYLDNQFEAGSNAKCGVYGPVTSADGPAVTWTNNTWLDGPNAGQEVSVD